MKKITMSGLFLAFGVWHIILAGLLEESGGYAMRVGDMLGGVGIGSLIASAALFVSAMMTEGKR